MTAYLWLICCNYWSTVSLHTCSSAWKCLAVSFSCCVGNIYSFRHWHHACHQKRSCDTFSATCSFMFSLWQTKPYQQSMLCEQTWFTACHPASCANTCPTDNSTLSLDGRCSSLILTANAPSQYDHLQSTLSTDLYCIPFLYQVFPKVGSDVPHLIDPLLPTTS